MTRLSNMRGKVKEENKRKGKINCRNEAKVGKVSGSNDMNGKVE